MSDASTAFDLRGGLVRPIARIGVDLDNTLCETSASWMARFARRCVAPAPHAPLSTEAMLSTYTALVRLCEPCFLDCLGDDMATASHAPVVGALPVLTAFRAANIEVHALTARPLRDLAPTLAWFEANGFDNVIATIAFAPSKRTRCEALSLRFLIDDAPAYIEELADSTCEPIVFDRPYNRSARGRRINSWAQALSLASDLQASRRVPAPSTAAA